METVMLQGELFEDLETFRIPLFQSGQIKSKVVCNYPVGNKQHILCDEIFAFSYQSATPTLK